MSGPHDESRTVDRKPVKKNLHRFLLVSGAALLTLFNPSVAQITPNDQAPAQPQNQPEFQLKVKSNLVVVRVAVRDSGGKPIEGLRKEDFKLFDRGKEQIIAQFDVENSHAASAVGAAPVSGENKQVSSSSAVGSSSPAKPSQTTNTRFVALYFDDLNATDADLARARNAADRYLTTGIHREDRIGVFTSDKMLSDFTSDLRQIHEALAKLHASSHALYKDQSCPTLSDYQAYEITQFQNDTRIDAWKTALDEAYRRGCGGRDETRSQAGDIDQSALSSPSSITQPRGSLQQISQQGYDPAAAPILVLAHQIVEQNEMQAKSNLQELRQVARYCSHMPGQRTILLVSPGFLSLDLPSDLDRLINQALQMQVVISSMDVRGLDATTRVNDVENGSGGATGMMSAAESRMDTARESAASDVMVELAQGTGGEFFHHDNDLQAGFDALAGSPVYYILAFSPSNATPDEEFHVLKVSLSDGHKGVSIQARRGYFATKEDLNSKPVDEQVEMADSDPQAPQRIRDALLSKDERKALPVEVRTEVSKGGATDSELSVLSHLDTKSLHFHKEGDHNQNVVTFVCVIFDDKGKSAGGQQQKARLDVAENSLAHLMETGVNVKLTFHLKSGNYMMREVVTDSQDHLVTAQSQSIQIP